MLLATRNLEEILDLSNFSACVVVQKILIWFAFAFLFCFCTHNKFIIRSNDKRNKLSHYYYSLLPTMKFLFSLGLLATGAYAAGNVSR